MLYGAYGFTGRLIVEEATRRGHRPLLAGRDAERLASLARRYGLDWLALDLSDARRLEAAVRGHTLVLHAAGPFIHTADPMIRACLAAGAHYLDITGEIPVLENTFRYHDQAQAAGVALISGAGFDIAPSDCLAAYVARRLPGATQLETAISAPLQVTSGTVKSMLEMLSALPSGAIGRRNGRLVSIPDVKPRRLRFSDGRERAVRPAPWGDLVTAARTTGVENITCYLTLPDLPGVNAFSRLLSLGPVSRLAGPVVERLFRGPDEQAQQTARAYLWARVIAGDGQTVEAWLETVEVYRFTAMAAVRSVEKLPAGAFAGALTPAGAFGADFVLELEGTKRFDTLPPD